MSYDQDLPKQGPLQGEEARRLHHRRQGDLVRTGDAGEGTMTRLTLLLAALLLVSCAAPDAPDPGYSGVVTVAGNEPFTFTALNTGSEQFELAGPLVPEIRAQRQGDRVTVWGEVRDGVMRRVIEVRRWV